MKNQSYTKLRSLIENFYVLHKDAELSKWIINTVKKFNIEQNVAFVRKNGY